ncbi:MAG TPA: hypothetical protein P5560_12655 [Thermotogota bacterium]|nr:hypothetical protein [Thermotogota bacterium]HRW93794.1 hypothetical protein [Thermotogota bacterium]
MKKKVRLLFALSVVLFLVVVLTAVTCSVNPTPTGFSVTIKNFSPNAMQLFRNGSFYDSIGPGNQRVFYGFEAWENVSLYVPVILAWLADPTFTDYVWATSAYLTFEYYGGLTVNVSAILSPTAP